MIFHNYFNGSDLTESLKMLVSLLLHSYLLNYFISEKKRLPSTLTSKLADYK